MEYRKLKDLHPHDRNPRKIYDEDLEKLVESLRDNQDYFEARPLILSDRTGKLVIIAGNQRYAASKLLGLKEVPTHLIPNLTEEREKEIMARDNVNNGQWDEDMLREDEWNVEDMKNWGVNLPGFTDDDFSQGGEEEYEPKVDKSEFDKRADSYMNNTIRQIVLYFDVEEHKRILEELESIGEDYGIEDDNSEVVSRIIEFYREHTGTGGETSGEEE